MDQFQNIVVFSVFLLAVAYLVSKFVWTPSFLKKKSKDGCGDGNCGC